MPPKQKRKTATKASTSPSKRTRTQTPTPVAKTASTALDDADTADEAARKAKAFAKLLEKSTIAKTNHVTAEAIQTAPVGTK